MRNIEKPMTNNISSQRIKNKFAAIKKEGRAGLVSFNMAYDPDFETSLEIVKGLPEAGVDFIEIGMPFSDPMADGPAIQLAAIRALNNGSKLTGILSLVEQFRESDNETPVILMGYYNMILNYGEEKFCRDAVAAGVDGLIIVDLPPEEDTSLFNAACNHGLSFIKLLTPTTDEDRLKVILEKATGFLYYVSVAGITGTKSATEESIKKAVESFRKHTDLPIVVGFGIKSKEQVEKIGSIADAAVVGSAFVRKIEENLSDNNKAKEEVLKLARSLSY